MIDETNAHLATDEAISLLEKMLVYDHVMLCSLFQEQENHRIRGTITSIFKEIRLGVI